ncbi:hypothetical protein [Haloferula sp. A504]|uniref:hypothetical protein n=1 Tax=Haloferula sp. A504 TaxID=3373601 RepID=UPI0031C864FB|nr:hypothetical protein [Verrucomicrobiaceae bacterium E54]
MNIVSSIALLGAGCLLLSGLLEAKPRTCRIVYPERPRGAPKVAWLFDGEHSRSISLPDKTLSPVMPLPEGELVLVMTPEEVGAPEALPPQAPRLRIPGEVADFYILITPDPGNPVLPVRMDLVDSQEGGLKPGQTLWFNRTQHQIVAKLGDTALVVKSQARAISTKPAAESGYYTAEFQYRVNGEGPLVRITEQSWWHDAGSRHLGFIVSAGGRLPKIFFYRDFRSP